VTNKRATKGQRTRAKILEVALRLLQQHGYEATTMRATAKAADLSVANAYCYFPSKEHLVQA
jgi:AcrR family transcriptional regulator